MHPKSRFKVIIQLLLLVKPMAPVMLFTIIMGSIGYLSGIFISISGGYALLHILGVQTAVTMDQVGFIVMGLALTLSVSKYLEQLSGHYIAFKLLAQIRDQVFAVLRKLAPAKLEGRDKGNLITLITTDIELIEVFYAHTIAPVAIAFLTTGFMTFFIGQIHLYLGAIAFLGYLTVGVIIPMINGKLGKKIGRLYRDDFGNFNSYLLESLRGLRELIQYGQGEVRRDTISERSNQLSQKNKSMKNREGLTRAITDFTILSFGLLILSASVMLVNAGALSPYQVLIATLALLGSFGPTVALSALSNDLMQTLASGERVIHLLNEQPQVEDVVHGKTILPETFKGIECQALDFAYDGDLILKEVSLKIPSRKIVGVHGKSGSGKSTLLKLLMRFWALEQGEIYYVNEEKNAIQDINTASLRKMVSYVTQETYLFHDSIGENIRLSKPNATQDEVILAAKKASIHTFISGLPKGYDTLIGELGSTLSGGERQRIGLARAFLHDAPVMLLDEPTSNVDSLNEGIILKSIKEACEDKCVVLVSHRKSTLGITDLAFHMNRGRVS